MLPSMQSDDERAAEAAPHGSIADIVAIIESAKARDGRGALERHIDKALPEADEAEVREAADLAIEVIESMPVLLARARQESEERGLESIVDPLLDRAERYYRQPLDLIPEMTQGLVGLLDDTYLVIRTLQNLDKGREPFLDWDLDYPARFLQRLIGAAIAQRLDEIATQALEDVSARLEEVWWRTAHRA
jgi:uncharacterized membrane protein YkvA (DUF1232 family)